MTCTLEPIDLGHRVCLIQYSGSTGGQEQTKGDRKGLIICLFFFFVCDFVFADKINDPGLLAYEVV